MTIPQMKLCEQFAEGILQHFKRINIVGKCILENDTVKVQILVYGKTISTTISLGVILNVISNIESWQVVRFEIISELTKGIEDTGKKKRKKIK